MGARRDILGYRRRGHEVAQQELDGAKMFRRIDLRSAATERWRRARRAAAMRAYLMTLRPRHGPDFGQATCLIFRQDADIIISRRRGALERAGDGVRFLRRRDDFFIIAGDDISRERRYFYFHGDTAQRTPSRHLRQNAPSDGDFMTPTPRPAANSALI